MNQETGDLQHLRAVLRITQNHIDHEAEKGDSHTLDETVQSHVPVLTFRYVHTTRPSSQLEAEIRHLWHTVIEAAKNWDAANPKQDTLVRYVLSARARGRLTRPLKDIDGDDPIDDERLDATPFSDGNLFWSDLPHLGRSMMEEWAHQFHTANRDHEDNLRQNLAAFVGRLMSVGIWDGSAACALSLFRETLETQRPLTLLQVPDIVKNETETGLPTQSLISALLQMLYYSEGSIVDPSNNSGQSVRDLLSPETSELGELAMQSGLSSPGFNPDRWRFWIQRLEALTKCEVLSVAEKAESCLDVMRSATESIYGPLASKLKY